MVDILREFLEAQELLQQLAERFERDELTFAELQGFVGDDDGRVLFRLKEKCHALFRPEAGGGQPPRVREALFDLAVGSLFHEAMKFREDFYQREVYGPRVRQLRTDAGADAGDLFRQFERLLSAVSERLGEGLAQTQSLMDQSWKQLRVLLADQPDPGFATRFLIERRETLDQLNSPGLEALLVEIHGDAASGYEIAGRSYLVSGHYEAAQFAFAEAIRRNGELAEVEQLSLYASAMAAYLEGRYAQTVSRLGAWIDRGRIGPASLEEVAMAALSSLDQLVDERDREAVVGAASKLLEKIRRSSTTDPVEPDGAMPG
jgi:hypothetical protein